jgi:hypothetical protein
MMQLSVIAGSVVTENIVAAEMLVSLSRAVNSDILGAQNNSSFSKIVIGLLYYSALFTFRYSDTKLLVFMILFRFV